MFKPKKFLAFLSPSLLLVTPFLALAEESFTITTYYPSPHGSYNQLQTNSLGVGDNDNNGGLDSGDVPDPTTNPGEVWIKGKVGIGTTSPNVALDVAGTINANAYKEGNKAISGKYVQLQATTPGTQQTGNLNISGSGLFDGNVGIGTTRPGGPEARLKVLGSARIGGQLNFQESVGLVVSIPGQIWNSALKNAALVALAGGQDSYALYVNNSSGDWGYDIYVSTTTGRSYFCNKVGIGTTNPVDHFQVNDIESTKRFGVPFGSNNLYAYGAYQTAWSDRRLKENIQSQHGVLSRIMAVKPVTYYWKPGLGLDNKMHYGVIAQELREIFPTLVYEDQDGHLNVQRDEMQFVLIQSVKELKAENDVLKAQNLQLETRIKRLEARLR